MKSATAKGKALAKYVSLRLRRIFPKARPMPRSGALRGAFPGMSGDLGYTRPLRVECKNTDQLALKASWEQARGQKQSGEYPVLVWGRGHWQWDHPDEKPMVVMELDDFVNLLQEAMTYGLADAKEKKKHEQGNPR